MKIKYSNNYIFLRKKFKGKISLEFAKKRKNNIINKINHSIKDLSQDILEQERIIVLDRDTLGGKKENIFK